MRMNLSDALRRFRKHANITQKQAAQGANASERVYQDYEYGKVIPSATVLIALADSFDVSLDYLVGRSDDPVRRSGTPSTQLAARINNLPQREQKIVSALVDALEEYEKV